MSDQPRGVRGADFRHTIGFLGIKRSSSCDDADFRETGDHTFGFLGINRSRSCEEVRPYTTSTQRKRDLSPRTGLNMKNISSKQFNMQQNNSNIRAENILPKSHNNQMRRPDLASNAQPDYNQRSHQISYAEPHDISHVSRSRYHQQHMDKEFIPGQPISYNTSHTQINQSGNLKYSEQNNTKGPPLKEEKEKKLITTKTFAHGMMDISLLTSNATQLRSVVSTPDHDFYTLLIWLISLSVVLQITSGVLLVMADYFKTHVKEKDRQSLRKRKLLNVIALAMVTIVTSLNILISAFYLPGVPQNRPELGSDMSSFASSEYQSIKNHTEL